jgi:methylmalonyl-CoA mutase
MTASETLSLAGDFTPATDADWRKLVDSVLKGAPFKRLESKTYDGLTIEPLYARASTASAIAGRPGGAAWTLMQRVDHPDPAAANVQALDDLQNGATGLVLVFPGSVSANGYGLDPSAASLKLALKDIDLGAISIDLNLSPQTRHVASDFAALVKSSGLPPTAADIRFSINPIGGFAAAGHSPQNWPALAPTFAAMVGELAGQRFHGPFAVADGRIIHNAGGSDTQELAFALASAVAYLRALEASGMTVAAARDAIYFRLSADADQFLTMAKFRAVRKLWARVETACGLPPKQCTVMAETAWRMMTRRDAYANMLRTAIAVTAAGFGGADAITALPHTAPLGLADAFARRTARNTQLVLLEESNLARVGDPAAGSGALEAITIELCTVAWSQFQAIEKTGGVWAALESGLIQREVGAVRAEREKAVARGKDILTGTNAYPNLGESTPAVLNAKPITAPDQSSVTVKTEAIPRIRLAEPFEILRDKSDLMLGKTGARPKVSLATLGSQADFTPRATFAKNFFEAGGIEAVSEDGGALVCLCSSDKVYEKEAVAAVQTLKASGAKHILLAGRPGEREAELRSEGVQSFIYDGCDVLSTLNAAYAILSQ